MPNEVSYLRPPPTSVTADANIVGIEVRAVAPKDTVDAPSSEIGIVVNNNYSRGCGLQLKNGTEDIYIPSGAFPATNGPFKIRAKVQFNSGGMPSENIPGDSGTFTGT